MRPISIAPPPPPALSELNQSAAEAWAVARGLPAYRGRQLYRALAVQGLQHVRDLSEFPASLREEVSQAYRTRTLEVRAHLRSSRDASEKVLFALHDKSTVETVLISARKSNGRARETVCVSSQVGCPAGCTFCATGLGGFGRNLTAAEIVDQVMYFAHALRP